MLKIIITVTACLFFSVAHAEPCASIEHAELKEMSTEELTKEYCKAIKQADSNTKEYLDMKLGGYGSSERRQAASEHGDMCRNEADKIKRALVRKGQPEDAVNPKMCQK